MRKVLPILTLVLFAVALVIPLSSPQPVESQTATEALTTDMDAKTDDLFNGFGARGGHRSRNARLAYPPLKNLPKNQEIVTYCACPKDQSSIAAAQILKAAGFKRVKVLQGGWQEWLRANGPVEPRTKTD